MHYYLNKNKQSLYVPCLLVMEFKFQVISALEFYFSIFPVHKRLPVSPHQLAIFSLLSGFNVYIYQKPLSDIINVYEFVCETKRERWRDRGRERERETKMIIINNQ